MSQAATFQGPPSRRLVGASTAAVFSAGELIRVAFSLVCRESCTSACGEAPDRLCERLRDHVDRDEQEKGDVDAGDGEDAVDPLEDGRIVRPLDLDQPREAARLRA